MRGEAFFDVQHELSTAINRQELHIDFRGPAF